MNINPYKNLITFTQKIFPESLFPDAKYLIEQISSLALGKINQQRESNASNSLIPKTVTMSSVKKEDKTSVIKEETLSNVLLPNNVIACEIHEEELPVIQEEVLPLAPIKSTTTLQESKGISKAIFLWELKNWKNNPLVTGNKEKAVEIITEAFLKKKKTLDLSLLVLNSLPSCIGYMTQLEELMLINNKLTSIPSEIGNLTELRELNLSFNNLYSLPTDIGRLSKLEMLNLSSNPLTSIPTQIGNLSMLQELNLSYNKLCSLPTCIGHLSKLEKLYLDGSELEAIPSEIGNFIQLKKLTLSYNKLTSIPTEIGNLIQLQELKLNDNKLTFIPAEIGNLAQLQMLNLSYNKLSYIPAQIGNLTQLGELKLNHNKLTSLPPEIGQLNELKEIRLDENPDLAELPLSLGNLRDLTNLDVELTLIPRQIAETILDACKALRVADATNMLSARLKKWLGYTNKDLATKTALITSLSHLTDLEKETLNEWLLRLEKTKDFARDQKKMVDIALGIIQSIVKDVTFRETFINHAAANNEHCPDRAAMALNEIYVPWKLHTLPNDASRKDKMDLLISAAKTQILRRIVVELIDKNMTSKEESVEVFLYCEIQLSKKQPLLSPIKNMIYETIGKRDWIDLADIEQQVLRRYTEYLNEYPAFKQIVEECENNKEFSAAWEKEKAPIFEKMDQLYADLERDEADPKKISEQNFKTKLEKLQTTLEHKKVSFMRSF